MNNQEKGAPSTVVPTKLAEPYPGEPVSAHKVWLMAVVVPKKGINKKYRKRYKELFHG